MQLRVLGYLMAMAIIQVASSPPGYRYPSKAVNNPWQYYCYPDKTVNNPARSVFNDNMARELISHVDPFDDKMKQDFITGIAESLKNDSLFRNKLHENIIKRLSLQHVSKDSISKAEMSKTFPDVKPISKAMYQALGKIMPPYS